MRNQRSWRLLTEIEPNTTNIKVSKVIWKTNSSGQSFYPLFTIETTVVLMSDDKKTFETCKATADGNWNMVLTKRWLSDDKSETQINRFKRDWLPWTYMFATMAAWDLPALWDANTWTWDQTFVWDVIISGDLDVTWDFKMNTTGDIDLTTNDWNIKIETNNWITTFKDMTVWPVTLSQMIKPPTWWSAIEVMSESDFQQIAQPDLNTAYFRYINL